MARKNYDYERNPWKMVLYILAVVFFVVCIGYLLMYTGKEKQEYREEVERVSALEDSDQLDDEKNISDNKDAAEAVPTPAEDVADAGATPTEAAAGITPTPEATEASPTPTEAAAGTTPTPEVTEAALTPTDAAAAAQEQQVDTAVNAEDAVKEMSILVLNGTKRPGVAGYWKTELEKAGYKNIFPATYTKAAEQQTVILTEKEEYAQPLLALFPNAQIRIGSVYEGIELQPGETIPEKSDIYLIIGNLDVKM